jgi:hypothetical protein
MATPAIGAKPLLTGMNPEDEDPLVSYKRNEAWAKPGPYVTKLSPAQEAEFQKWAAKNPQLVSGEINTKTPDYDVRGRWLAEKQGDPAAKLTMNKWDHKLHASDKWKTPYDAVFSKESIYAKPDAPYWKGDKLYTAKGELIVDETPKKVSRKGTSIKGSRQVTGSAAKSKRVKNKSQRKP